MRFNKQELVAIASQTSQNFDREGILVLKEKQDGFFRRSEGYSARWFRLRGNLLFYLRDTEPLSEPTGVVVLGRHSIKMQPQDEHGHWPFQIVWDNGVIYRMATFLESERTLWLKAIQSAPYDNLKTQIAALKEKLKGVPPIMDISAWRRKHGIVIDMNEIPVCEVALSCDNLACDGDGRPPSPRVLLHVRHRGLWLRLGNTEVVHRCSNPSFARTLQFRACDGLSPSSSVRLTAQDVRERLSDVAVTLGAVSLPLSALQEAQRLRIALTSADKKTVGFITLNGWSLEPSYVGTSPSHTNDRNSVDIPQKILTHRRSQSLPCRLGVRLKCPSSDAVLRGNFANWSQASYRLHSGLGGDIAVHELMAEPRLCFTLPTQLLDIFIQREKELLEELVSLGEMSGEWKTKQLELVHAHISLLKHYCQAKRSLLSVPEGVYFKQSSQKEDASLEFAPVNLHLQRMWVHNDTLNRAGFHDVITVGAFTAHAHKADTRGGLIRLVQQVKDISSTKAVFNSTAVSKILTEYDNIITARLLRDQIVQIVDKMCLLVQSNQDISSLLEMLISKTRTLVGLWDRGAVEEAMAFMMWHRAKDNGVTGIHQPVSTIQHLSEQLTKLELLNSDYDSLEASSSSSKVTTPECEPPLSASVPDIHNYVQNLQLRDTTHLTFHNDYFKPETPKLAETQTRSFDRGLWRPDFKSSTSLEHVSYRSLMESNKETEERREAFSLTQDETSREVTSLRPMTSELEEALAAVVDAIHSVNSGGEAPEAPEAECSLERLRASSEQLSRCLERAVRHLGCQHAALRLRLEPSAWTRTAAALQARRDACLSQALTTLSAGLVCWASSTPHDVILTLLSAGLGPLCGFEGLLSLYLSEEAMWGDMVVAVEDLQTVVFSFVKSPQCPKGIPQVNGSRGHLRVHIPVTDSLYNKFANKDHLSFTVTAVFFNVGINEKATLSEALHETGPQRRSNCDNLRRLLYYCQKHRRLFPPPPHHTARASPRSKPLEEVMEHLKTEVYRQAPKNVAILHLAAQATRLMHGLRFTSCKSAKDRTGMSATIEQTDILAATYHLADNQYQKAKDIFRSEGCRRENAEKNIGVRKYAFNKRQVAALPDAYKPPPGTYGSTQS